MSDITKTPGGPGGRVNPWDKPTQASTKRIEEFLQAAKPSEAARRAGKAKLIFALDATASRQPTWDTAMKVQGEMFMTCEGLGELEISLIYFRGYGECQASRWVARPKDLLHLMTGISCRAGHTQISKVLNRALQETEKGHIHALVYIGDAFEESLDRCVGLAHELGTVGTKMFLFREGQIPEAKEAFEAMAKASGGAHLELNATSAGHLKNLLAAVATFAVGGLEALARLGTSEAKELLRLTSGPSPQPE